MKSFLKSCIPPICISTLNHVLNRGIRWVGDFSSWDKAVACSRGYNPDFYLEKPTKAVKVVQNDETKCERDSVLFDKIIYPYPLLTNLFALTTFLKAQSVFILDFGGSLGTSYFQNRKFLRFLPRFTWNILEQEKIIQAGKTNFENQELHFYQTLDEAKTQIHSTDTKILILSSVLQYLKDPYDTLKQLMESIEFDAVLIDRTPFSQDGKAHIVLQKVPKSIYDTELPAHLLLKSKFLNFMSKEEYQLIDEFESYCDENNNKVKYLGFSFYKKQGAVSHV